MKPLTSSRREVMRAFTIAPVLIAAPVTAQAVYREHDIALAWNEAVQAVQATRIAADRFETQFFQPLMQAYRNGTATLTQVCAMEDASCEWEDAYTEAVTALVHTPAPDVAAAAEKLRLGNEKHLFDMDCGPDPLLALLADEIARLAVRERR